MGGTARVSVVVEERWRAAALVAEMRLRGLPATCVSTVDEHFGVRTPYSSVLSGLALAWLHGAVKLPPAGFALEGRRLRLWMMAAGYRDGLGVTLRIGRCEEAVPKTLQRALATVGLPSDIVGVSSRTAGPSLRISGRRRVARFGELVGDAPVGTSAEEWP
jgi:hypothetical protein